MILSSLNGLSTLAEKSFDCICDGLFLGFLFIPSVYMSVCFDYCSFVAVLKWEWELQLCFSFSRLFRLFESLEIPHEFYMDFSTAVKKQHWDFNRDYIESVGCFGQCWHLNHVKSSNPWIWDVIPCIGGFFNFFQQYTVVFSVQVFHLLG